MIVFVSQASGAFYRKVLKPILFKRQPDEVHARLLVFCAAMQRLWVIRVIMKRMWAYKNPAYLRQTLMGLQFENPVGLSAGFDKNITLAPTMQALGFGLMEGGSLTRQQCDGNARPWFYRLPKSRSLVVHVGLANDGTAAIIERIKAYRAGTFKAFPLNISVAKTNIQAVSNDTVAIADYVGSLKLIAAGGVSDLITLNISCPNAYGGEPFTTPKRLERLLRQVDRLDLRQPLFIKMPVDLPWGEFRQLLEVASDHKVAGVTIGNLTKIRTGLQDHLPAAVLGGLSGKPTFKRSNQLIAKTYRAYGNRFTIIGVGGIFTAEDAYVKIKLGASLVEMITGMIFEGPQVVGQINRGLVKLLRQDGYHTISQAVGAAIADTKAGKAALLPKQR